MTLDLPARFNNLRAALAMTLAIVLLGGCTHISLDKNPKSPAGTKTPAATNATANGDKHGAMSLTGNWQFGFQFNNSTLQSSVHIDQQGNKFQGTGKDEQTGREFNVEQGEISNNGTHVEFFKKYTTGTAPEIKYMGDLELSTDKSYKGPYMHGDYQTIYRGQPVQDLWEAEMTPDTGSDQSASTTPQPAPAPTVPSPPRQSGNGLLNHTPELSGKWNTGYEYNFKTIHSTMFLEQDGDRIGGHGIDHETHEKFVIEKGWYHYPKLTLIRKWPKQSIVPSKGKKAVTHQPHSMVFKATVSMLSDKDYSGPYMSGKTSGGGAWEAQLYK